jgi:hypothetical protein
MRMIGFDFFNNAEPPASEDLAKAWKPYIETCLSFLPARVRRKSHTQPQPLQGKAEFKGLVGLLDSSSVPTIVRSVYDK